MLLSEQAYQRIDRELKKFPADQKRSAIMAALTIAQEEKGWVSTEVAEDVAEYLGVPPLQVQEVLPFYDMFHTKPVRIYTFSVCTNLPRPLRDGVMAGEYLKQRTGNADGGTTPDRL